jgi:RNA polymerase sigma-70 factor (ECF subfamily)
LKIGGVFLTSGVITKYTQKSLKNSNKNEAELVARIKNGDEKAFVQLIDKFSEKLYRKALSMVSNPDDAQDILQEAYLSAFRAFPKFRGESGIYTWLYRIVINKAKDHLGKRKTKKENLINHQEIHFQDERINYQKNIELDDDSNFLCGIISTMDPIYRDILVRRYFDELSYQEIGEVCGINIGTVKSRLFKAKEILKKLIISSDRGGDFFAL